MPYEINGRRFLGWWLASSIFIYPLALAITVALFIPVSMVTGFIPAYDISPVVDFVLATTFIGAIGAAIGYSMGALQRWLLRKYLYWTADHWQRNSTLGGIVGAWAAAFVLSVLNARIYDYSYANDSLFLMMMPPFVLVVATVQWFALRQAVRFSWMWIFANVVGGLVYVALLRDNIANSWDWDGFTILGLILLAMLAQGFVTGSIMLWLFEKHSYEVESTDDPLAKAPGAPASIWDNAI